VRSAISLARAAGPSDDENLTGRLTAAEAVAVSLITVLVAAVVASYLLDRLGAAIAPVPALVVSLACGAATIWWWSRASPRQESKAWPDLVGFAGTVLAVLAALLWLAWPELLPVGGGSDLTHHLQLIDFIDRHWRLAHSAADALLVGNMVNYTPGSHLLAAMAGAWTRSDGLHAIYPLVALSVAIKAGLVFLIVCRMQSGAVDARGRASDRLRMPIAIGSVLLLWLPYDYFIGSFARFSFFAQVVSEMFAVAMWLALVLWNDRPSALTAVFFALSGVGVFLTWPVWIGPPVLVLVVLALAGRYDTSMRRLRLLAYALGPIAIVAALHAFGRAESVAIVQTGGAAFSPTVSRFGWPFLLLSAAGSILAVRHRSSRVTVLLLAAVALQTLALLVVAVVAGADSPYMAFKMLHFAIYPMAAAAALALSGAFQILARAAEAAAPEGWLKRHGIDVLMWVLVVASGAATGARFVSAPRPVPAITEDLYRAGLWARAHVQPDCVEYLVEQDSTSYWLHQAVLGNPMQPPPGAASPVFVYHDALVRWITRTSFPLAIADLSVVPREVREDLVMLAQFGGVAVGRRRGTTECPAH
jgi:hypothetical protein